MKKLIATLLISNLAMAQVAVDIPTVSSTGALLEFNNATGNTKGIIVPNVTDVTTMTNPARGTIVFDRATARMKYFNGFWQDLSDKTGTAPTRLSGNDIATAKTVIGSPSSTAEGALVLESTNKALVLPHIIDPVTNVKSPAAGMICYDPNKKLFCVYNGKEWFFWK